MTWEVPRESDNHQPTELCPHPEWWTAWNAISTEVEMSMLVAAFVKATQPEFVLEIGSHWGQTTMRIGLVLMENKHGHLVSLEIDEPLCGSAKQRCIDNGVAEDVYEIVNINSLEYIPPKPIDLLFIDGGPTTRAADLIHFMPYLSKYPVVIAHDSDYYLDDNKTMLDVWDGGHISIHSPRGMLIMMR